MEKQKEKEYNNSTEESSSSSTSLEEEIKAGEWQRLKEFTSYMRRSRQGKIIATYQAISNRLTQLVSLYYQLCRDNPEKAVRLLKELKRLRFLQSFLLECIIWEEQGELEDKDIPLELEGFF